MNDAAFLQQENAQLKAQLAAKDALLEKREQRIHTLEKLIKQFQLKRFAPSNREATAMGSYLR